MRKLILLVVLILIARDAYPDDRGDTAGRLLDECESRAMIFANRSADAPYGSGTTKQIEDAAVCFNYIDGFVEGLMWGTGRHGINFPESSSFEDYVDAFVNYMLRHPELKDKPKSVVLYEALSGTYGEKR